MRHPFDLDPSELDALELDCAEIMSDQEAAQVSGGLSITTLALGEEGGTDCGFMPVDLLGRPRPFRPRRPSKPIAIDEPIFTTLAIGEEGGDCVEY